MTESKMTDVTVSNITELVAVAASLHPHLGRSKHWWRGQADSRWKLVPSIHHKGASLRERNLTFRFMHMAKSRHRECPPNADHSGWLFLMQHYGLPTRLLDWTDSLLVALYFAIEDAQFDGVEASLWAMSPAGLNFSESGEGLVYSADHERLLPVVIDAFAPAQGSTDRIVAVLTDQRDVRQLVQQSVFTIHGRETPIEDIPDARQFLARVRIPAAAKQEFRMIADLLGVGRATLFPDLANLAADLASRQFTAHPNR